MALIDVLTIDGPAGAGKSTVSKIAAERLGYAYLDTGAMYRAVTLMAIRSRVDWEDKTAIIQCASEMHLEMRQEKKGLRVFLDGEDVTMPIRDPEVTKVIYRVDQIPEVRQHLVRLQRTYGERQPTVAEGRDMGTVVFPDAKCKIFLDANLEERVKRRAKDFEQRGIQVDLDVLRQDILDRDEKNKTRATSPLKPAPDAHYIDTSGMPVEDVVQMILRLARNAGLPKISHS